MYLRRSALQPVLLRFLYEAWGANLSYGQFVEALAAAYGYVEPRRWHRVVNLARSLIETLREAVPVDPLLELSSVPAQLRGISRSVVVADCLGLAELYWIFKRLREQAGKRTLPRTPPLFLPVRFIMPEDGEERGDKNAPCVVDLRKGELRIPSYSVRVRLRASLIRALAEENGLTPRPEFVLQLTSRGKLRIIAHRALPLPQLRTPLRVIAIDENSRHGFAIAAFDFDDRGCKLAYFEKLRPPNHGYRRQLAAHLQSFAGKATGEKRTQLGQLLPEELVKALTPEKARKIARQARKKERRLNDAFVQRFAARVRELVREARRRGAAVAILVDPIDHESLRGTGLQGTLLRARRALESLALYEGALFTELRASGKRCPLCGSEGTEVRRTKRARVYKCWRCGVAWDRDKAALYNLTAEYFERLRKEGRGTSALAERALASLKQWLKKHPRALER